MLSSFWVSMIRAINIRIYPNKMQRIQIHKTIGCSRFIFNQMLAERKNIYEQLKHDKEVLKKHTYKTEKEYKAQFPFLKEADSIALQASREHLFEAYQSFFNGLKKKIRLVFLTSSQRKEKKIIRRSKRMETLRLILKERN